MEQRNTSMWKWKHTLLHWTLVGVWKVPSNCFKIRWCSQFHVIIGIIIGSIVRLKYQKRNTQRLKKKQNWNMLWPNILDAQIHFGHLEMVRLRHIACPCLKCERDSGGKAVWISVTIHSDAEFDCVRIKFVHRWLERVRHNAYMSLMSPRDPVENDSTLNFGLETICCTNLWDIFWCLGKSNPLFQIPSIYPARLCRLSIELLQTKSVNIVKRQKMQWEIFDNTRRNMQLGHGNIKETGTCNSFTLYFTGFPQWNWIYYAKKVRNFSWKSVIWHNNFSFSFSFFVQHFFAIWQWIQCTNKYKFSITSWLSSSDTIKMI